VGASRRRLRPVGRLVDAGDPHQSTGDGVVDAPGVVGHMDLHPGHAAQGPLHPGGGAGAVELDVPVLGGEPGLRGTAQDDARLTV